MRTLIDEYGDTGILQPVPDSGTIVPRLGTENRRDSRGRRLGPKPYDPRSYCERQIAPKDSDAPTDVRGQVIDGP